MDYFSLTAGALAVVVLCTVWLLFFRGSSRTLVSGRSSFANVLETQTATNNTEGYYEVSFLPGVDSSVIDAFNRNAGVTALFDAVQPCLDFFLPTKDQRKCTSSTSLNTDRLANFKASVAVIMLDPDIRLDSDDALFNYASIMFTFLQVGVLFQDNAAMQGTLAVNRDAQGVPVSITSDQPVIRFLASYFLLQTCYGDLQRGLVDIPKLRVLATRSLLRDVVAFNEQAGFATPKEAAIIRDMNDSNCTTELVQVTLENGETVWRLKNDDQCGPFFASLKEALKNIETRVMETALLPITIDIKLFATITAVGFGNKIADQAATMLTRACSLP